MNEPLEFKTLDDAINVKKPDGEDKREIIKKDKTVVER